MAPAAMGRDGPPNIVLVLADDLGWGDVGFNGRTEWSTPRLDRLASRGVLLRRCYSAGTVCAPSRAALLTGKSTIHSGVRLNDEDLPLEEITIAEALRPRGYATALFGKWHGGKPRDGRTVSGHPMDQGFDEFYGYTDAVKAWEKFPDRVWDGRAEVRVSGRHYFDDLITDRAIDFVGRHGSKPFFLAVTYIATHFRIEAPADEVERHRARFMEFADGTVRATYAAMVTRLDANVGRIMDRLDALGLAENTLVVFASDHGATFEKGNRGASAALDSNRPLRGQKRTLWEGGLRVPAFACWPARIRGGRSCDGAICLTDLLPTFLAAAGAEPDPAWHVDGVNVLAAWEGRDRVPERTLFWEWRGEGYHQVAAMRGDLKLVISRGGLPELFDVGRDLEERRDVGAAYPDLTEELSDALKAWLATEVRRPQR